MTRRKIQIFLSAIGIAVSLISIASCGSKDKDTYSPTPFAIEKPSYFPNKTNIPDDNPMTEEGVALGERLFHDKMFGARDDKQVCCATCHHREHSYENGGAQLSTHHTMLPLINIAWNNNGLGWNGGVNSIETMVYLATTSPYEIDGDTTAIAERLRQSDDYTEMFNKAFCREPSFADAQRAIAQYVRSLVSCNSKFDRYLLGHEQLTQDELNGYVLFVTEDGADCFHCHGGGGNALFTTNLFYNNGLSVTFDDPEDRYSVTHDPSDRGAYKVPTLRNVALTGPYMHDGRFSTIDEVIDFYSDGVSYSDNVSPLMHHVMQGGVQLTIEEKQQLKAFLNTLTDSTFIGR